MAHEKPPAEQGALFAEETRTTGATDPALAGVQVSFTPVEGGVYPADTVVEPPPRTPEQLELDASVHAAVGADNRRKGQLGKHSAIDHEGRYATELEPGMFLPGFGPVTYRNLAMARDHVEQLNAKRKGAK